LEEACQVHIVGSILKKNQLFIYKNVEGYASEGYYGFPIYKLLQG